jgi:hypothetical protein
MKPDDIQHLFLIFPNEFEQEQILLERFFESFPRCRVSTWKQEGAWDTFCERADGGAVIVSQLLIAASS